METNNVVNAVALNYFRQKCRLKMHKSLKASYCSTDCQDSHRKKHRQISSDKVQVKETGDGRGLGVFAVQSFVAGDELIRETPLLKVKNFDGQVSPSWIELGRYISNEIESLPEAKHHVVMSFTNAFLEDHKTSKGLGILKQTESLVVLQG